LREAILEILTVKLKEKKCPIYYLCPEKCRSVSIPRDVFRLENARTFDPRLTVA